MKKTLFTVFIVACGISSVSLADSIQVSKTIKFNPGQTILIRQTCSQFGAIYGYSDARPVKHMAGGWCPDGQQIRVGISDVGAPRIGAFLPANDSVDQLASLPNVQIAYDNLDSVPAEKAIGQNIYEALETASPQTPLLLKVKNGKLIGLTRTAPSMIKL